VGPLFGTPNGQSSVNRPFSGTLRHSSPLQKAELEFSRKIQDEMTLSLAYEDSNVQAEARRAVPLTSLEERARGKLSGVENSPATFKDALFVELLEWFKSDFFSWVDRPKCHLCGGDTQARGQVGPTAEEMKDGARNVESYSCLYCNALVRFPRYHSQPGKLLSWRKGRCGEFANCFALICRCLGYDVRRALDWTDHVWVEVWSETEGRWLHADPCESACDKPLLYEVRKKAF